MLSQPASARLVIPLPSPPPQLLDGPRNRVERLINRLKQFRRIATRYEKRGINYLAMVMLGMILLWL